MWLKYGHLFVRGLGRDIDKDELLKSSGKMTFMSSYEHYQKLHEDIKVKLYIVFS